jgi:hypothetical protein
MPLSGLVRSFAVSMLKGVNKLHISIPLGQSVHTRMSSLMSVLSLSLSLALSLSLSLSLSRSLSLSLSWGRYWSLVLGPHIARQMFNPLNHTPSPFHVSYFSDRVLCLCPGPASDHNPSTQASFIAEITDVYHHAWIVCWDGMGSH